jgi:hypothetical protein
MAAMHTAALSHEPLWTRARALFARACAAFGGPAAVAALARLNAALRRRIMGWLAPLECIARKLLLAEAARLPAENLRARTPPRTQGEPAGARAAPDLSRPETWPARFRLAPPRDPHLVRDERAPRIRSLALDAHLLSPRRAGATAKAPPSASRADSKPCAACSKIRCRTRAGSRASSSACVAAIPRSLCVSPWRRRAPFRWIRPTRASSSTRWAPRSAAPSRSPTRAERPHHAPNSTSCRRRCSGRSAPPCASPRSAGASFASR